MAEENQSSKDSPKPILHVLVVGFHHKKGCQVEYSFPPLVEGDDPTACPPGWKYLPTLALPDGSHNYDEDAVYFHLPSLSDPKRTVYGISCYRQIPVEKLKIRTSDLTRSTVQKSVCVLSALPLYGHVQVKMALITHAYFDEGDFSQVKLLHDTYHHLNSCMDQLGPLSSAPQLFVGLSARDLILQFGHKVVLLFKLLLLERRLVFYRSPVQPLCAMILTLLSLHPGMIEQGLNEAACIRPSRPMSPIPDFSDAEETTCENSHNAAKEDLSTRMQETISTPITGPETTTRVGSTALKRPTDLEYSSLECDEAQEVIVPNRSGESASDSGGGDDGGISSVEGDQGARMAREDSMEKEGSTGSAHSSIGEVPESWMEVSAKLPISESIGNFPGGGGSESNLSNIAQMSWETCGLPLPLFTQGNLCLPYLSLPYMDLLSDVNVRGYIVGATNVLFKQKKNLADVLVEVEGARVETQDPELRRQLHLTTEDLRFAEYVVRRVTCERHDVFLDGVGWEGGDEWIRAQFKAYALCLLRTSLLQEGSREMDHFNASFMSAWKSTHNYRRWLSGDHNGIWDLNPGHPFAGQLSVSDMKLRLSHTMQNTEGGRKLNQAMTSTGRAVATTGRAVGGALSQAKGALSSWWSTFTTAPAGEGDGADPGGGESPQEGTDDGQTGSSTADGPAQVNIVNRSSRTSDGSEVRPVFKPVHADVVNTKMPSPTSSELNNFISSQQKTLASVENIECNMQVVRSSLEPNVEDTNKVLDSVLESKNSQFSVNESKENVDKSNKNLVYLKSEVVNVEEVQINEADLPKGDVLESLNKVDAINDAVGEVLRIS